MHTRVLSKFPAGKNLAHQSGHIRRHFNFPKNNTIIMSRPGNGPTSRLNIDKMNRNLSQISSRPCKHTSRPYSLHNFSPMHQTSKKRPAQSIQHYPYPTASSLLFSSSSSSRARSFFSQNTSNRFFHNTPKSNFFDVSKTTGASLPTPQKSIFGLQKKPVFGLNSSYSLRTTLICKTEKAGLDFGASIRAESILKKRKKAMRKHKHEKRKKDQAKEMDKLERQLKYSKQRGGNRR